MRKNDFAGPWKNVMVRLPIELHEKLLIAMKDKKGGIGKEIRSRLMSTFALGCISTYPLPPCEPRVDTPVGQELGDGVE